jgi:hypothetical protein
VKIVASIIDDPRSVATDILVEAEGAVTAGIAESGAGLKRAWRAQIEGAGFGRRLANTIRSQVYPAGEPSLRAAALIWTRAPAIVAAHDGGVLIRSAAGFWLAIPLEAAGTGLRGGRITPGEWERRTGRRLRFVYRRGRPALLVADDARIDTRGRAAAKGGRRRRDGILTGAQTVPVFLLVPQVKLPKRLDIDGLAAAAVAGLPAAILKNWRDPAR